MIFNIPGIALSSSIFLLGTSVSGAIFSDSSGCGCGFCSGGPVSRSMLGGVEAAAGTAGIGSAAGQSVWAAGIGSAGSAGQSIWLEEATSVCLLGVTCTWPQRNQLAANRAQPWTKGKQQLKIRVYSRQSWHLKEHYTLQRLCFIQIIKVKHSAIAWGFSRYSIT